MAPFARTPRRTAQRQLATAGRPPLAVHWDAALPCPDGGRSAAAPPPAPEVAQLAKENEQLLERQRRASEELKRIDDRLRQLYGAEQLPRDSPPRLPHSPPRSAVRARVLPGVFDPSPPGRRPEARGTPESYPSSGSPPRTHRPPVRAAGGFLPPPVRDGEHELREVCAGIAAEMDTLRNRILTEPSLLYQRDSSEPDLATLQTQEVVADARRLSASCVKPRPSADVPRQWPELADEQLAVVAAAEEGQRRAAAVQRQLRAAAVTTRAPLPETSRAPLPETRRRFTSQHYAVSPSPSDPPSATPERPFWDMPARTGDRAPPPPPESPVNGPGDVHALRPSSPHVSPRRPLSPQSSSRETVLRTISAILGRGAPPTWEENHRAKVLAAARSTPVRHISPPHPTGPVSSPVSAALRLLDDAVSRATGDSSPSPPRRL